MKSFTLVSTSLAAFIAILQISAISAEPEPTLGLGLITDTLGGVVNTVHNLLGNLLGGGSGGRAEQVGGAGVFGGIGLQDLILLLGQHGIPMNALGGASGITALLDQLNAQGIPLSALGGAGGIQMLLQQLSALGMPSSALGVLGGGTGGGSSTDIGGSATAIDGDNNTVVNKITVKN